MRALNKVMIVMLGKCSLHFPVAALVLPVFAFSRERIYGIWSFSFLIFSFALSIFRLWIGRKSRESKKKLFVLNFKSSHPSELFDCILCFYKKSFEFFLRIFVLLRIKLISIKRSFKNFSWELGICIGLLLLFFVLLLDLLSSEVDFSFTECARFCSAVQHVLLPLSSLWFMHPFNQSHLTFLLVFYVLLIFTPFIFFCLYFSFLFLFLR